MYHGKERACVRAIALVHAIVSRDILLIDNHFTCRFIEEEEAVEDNAQVAELSNDSDAPLKPNVSKLTKITAYTETTD